MKISALLYAIVIISFFMPFFMVSCEKTELMTINGIQLVTGGESKLKMDNPFSGINGDPDKEQEPQKIKAHPYAIVAIAIAILAVLASLVLPKKLYFVPVILSIGGVVFLYLLKSGMVGLISKADSGMGSAFDLTKILKVHSLYGFWVAMAGFLGGAILTLILGLRNNEEIVVNTLLPIDTGFGDPMTILPEDYLTETEFNGADIKPMEDVEDLEQEIKETLETSKIDE